MLSRALDHGRCEGGELVGGCAQKHKQRRMIGVRLGRYKRNGSKPASQHGWMNGPRHPLVGRANPQIVNHFYGDNMSKNLSRISHDNLLSPIIEIFHYGMYDKLHSRIVMYWFDWQHDAHGH